VKTTNATIRRAAGQRALSVPEPRCSACGGSGFLDYWSEETGEIMPAELCRATPACQRHAERAESWAGVAFLRMAVQMTRPG
jgi:hypothetical protein